MARGSAVASLDLAAQALRTAVAAQTTDRDPAHEDFYQLAAYVAALPQAVAELARVVAAQVAAYDTRYRLRDDAGGDPAARLRISAAELRAAAELLGRASRHAAVAQSAVGHVGVVGRRSS